MGFRREILRASLREDRDRGDDSSQLIRDTFVYGAKTVSPCTKDCPGEMERTFARLAECFEDRKGADELGALLANLRLGVDRFGRESF